MPKLYRLSIVACFSLIAGCGFHLRGSYQLPVFLSTLSLTVPKEATELKQQLLRSLEMNHINIGHDTGYQLVIITESIGTQSTIFDPRSQIMNTHLIYTLKYYMLSPDHKMRMNARPILEQNDYQSSPAAISGANEENNMLINDMRKDAVQQLLRRLQGIQLNQFQPTQGPAS